MVAPGVEVLAAEGGCRPGTQHPYHLNLERYGGVSLRRAGWISVTGEYGDRLGNTLSLLELSATRSPTPIQTNLGASGSPDLRAVRLMGLGEGP